MQDRRQALRELKGGHPDDERRVWYELRGANLDPVAVTRRMAITPDRAWRMGDHKPRTGRPQAEGAWMIDSGPGHHDEVHEHLDALLARMRPAWPEFVDLGQQFEASVAVAIHCHEAQGPLVEVLPDVARALAELDASLGFDLYALAEGREDLD